MALLGAGREFDSPAGPASTRRGATVPTKTAGTRPLPPEERLEKNPRPAYEDQDAYRDWARGCHAASLGYYRWVRSALVPLDEIPAHPWYRWCPEAVVGNLLPGRDRSQDGQHAAALYEVHRVLERVRVAIEHDDWEAVGQQAARFASGEAEGRDYRGPMPFLAVPQSQSSARTGEDDEQNRESIRTEVGARPRHRGAAADAL